VGDVGCGVFFGGDNVVLRVTGVTGAVALFYLIFEK
jgi:hypothetical protein